MQLWHIAVWVALMGSSGCFNPTLPAVACGDGNICPDNQVCQLPERVCAAPSADAAVDADPATADASSDGAELAVLIDRGLIIRYFFDEASSGTIPTTAKDAAPNPLDLPITYTPNLSYVTVDQHRGLRWSTSGAGGTVGIDVGGTKVEQALENSGAATLEMVVDVNDVTNAMSRLVHLGPPGGNGDVAFGAANATRIELTWFNGLFSSRWPYALVGDGRVVVHMVFDNTASGANNRLQVYIDGAPIAGRDGDTPDPDDQISLDNDAEISFGNRGGADRSIAGIMFYAASYSEALAPTEVANNAARLRLSDDR